MTERFHGVTPDSLREREATIVRRHFESEADFVTDDVLTRVRRP
jgi:cytochrome c-type biogenesis protein CcmE